MATLSRWTRRTPEWLGNHQAEEPFQVEIRRLTVEEFRLFKEGCLRISTGEIPATLENLSEIFSTCVRGPLGELEIDGVPVLTLGELLAAGADESSAKDGLLQDLVRLVIDVNRPTEKLLGESAGRPGSVPTTPPVPFEAGPAAPAAGA